MPTGTVNGKVNRDLVIVALKVSVGMEQILTLARGWRVDFAPKMRAEDLLLSFYTVQTVMVFFF